VAVWALRRPSDAGWLAYQFAVEAVDDLEDGCRDLVVLCLPQALNRARPDVTTAV
jgi:hypothetical protein